MYPIHKSTPSHLASPLSSIHPLSLSLSHLEIIQGTHIRCVPVFWGEGIKLVDSCVGVEECPLIVDIQPMISCNEKEEGSRRERMKQTKEENKNSIVNHQEIDHLLPRPPLPLFPPSSTLSNSYLVHGHINFQLPNQDQYLGTDLRVPSWYYFHTVQ